MHWDHLESDMLHVLPKPMKVVMVGGGQDSFIGRSIWIPIIRMIPELEFKWFVPSRDPLKAKRAAATMYHDSTFVSHDFSATIRRAIAADGPDDVLLCVAVETAGHLAIIKDALKAGVRWIVVDKPLVARYREWLELHEALDTHDASIFVTFNHTYNAAVHQLHLEVMNAEKEGQKIEIQGFFNQSWLHNQTTGKQAASRLADPWCSALDLGTHVFDLVACVAGKHIDAVSDAYVHHGLSGAAFSNVITAGSCNLHLDSVRVKAKASFDQAKPGNYMDDIGAIASFEDGRSFMWRMRHCGGNALLVGKSDSNPDYLGDWRQIESGGTEFANYITDTFSLTPPGHDSSGWPFMWWYLFQSILGTIWEDKRLPIVPYLQKHHQLCPPTFHGAGKQTIRAVEALMKSAETRDTVTLTSIR